MIQILLITGINLAVFFLLKWRLGNIGFLSFFLMFQATAQHLLVEQDIGPVSLRVYNTAVLALLCFFNFGRIAERLSMVPGLGTVFLVWLVYLTWGVISSAVNGGMADLPVFFINFLSKYVMATIVFLSALALLKTREEVKACVFWLACIAAGNAVFVVMQGAGVGQAWAIHSWLFPIVEMMRHELQLKQGAGTVYGYPPGLSSFSIATGYVLLCYGTIWALYAGKAWGESRRFTTVFCLSIWGAMMVAAILAMSRSALYFGAMFLIPMLVWRDRSGRWRWGLAGAMIVGVGILAVGFFSMRGMAVNISETRTMDLERVYDMAFSDRAELMTQSLAFIKEHPLFGGLDVAMSSGAIDLVPHNFILNAALYNGVLGAILMLLFCWFLVKAMIRNTWGDAGRRLCEPAFTHGLVLCALAYLAKGLVHNDSFVTGGLMGWYLVGLWAVMSSFRHPVAILSGARGGPTHYHGVYFGKRHG